MPKTLEGVARDVGNLFPGWLEGTSIIEFKYIILVKY
jgi:hypothetical protein